jgi:hypothetical protein
MTSCPCIQVNGQIAETACFIYHCIEINKEQLKCLGRIDYIKKKGIDTQGWDALNMLQLFRSCVWMSLHPKLVRLIVLLISCNNVVLLPWC